MSIRFKMNFELIPVVHYFYVTYNVTTHHNKGCPKMLNMPVIM